MKQKVNINPITEHHVACDVCHRTMLKGERAEPYLTPSRERRLVCQLCAPRAQREGWIREGAAPEMPARPQRPPERRGLLRRRRAAPQPDADHGAPEHAEPVQTSGMVERLDDDEEEPRRILGRRSHPRSPRHVKAVPTNAQLKIGRALEVFNGSEHPRTVAGIARTLGQPHASASTSKSSAAEVLLTVAWELSWYQFGVDLSDGREPVRLRGQGQELSELPPDSQDWNCTVDADGRIQLADGSGEQPPAPAEAVEPAPPGADAQSGGEPAERPV